MNVKQEPISNAGQNQSNKQLAFEKFHQYGISICSRFSDVTGSLSNKLTTATARKTSFKKWIRAASNFIALIPSRLIRQKLAIFSGVEF